MSSIHVRFKVAAQCEVKADSGLEAFIAEGDHRAARIECPALGLEYREYAQYALGIIPICLGFPKVCLSKFRVQILLLGRKGLLPGQCRLHFPKSL